ncbi:glycerophosphodiester phosphodiesterase family protein [Hymenobacter glacialis]|uniref:Glycerophosphodiester phosphodiesterase n=1 Tax=Hymenobacter glacialis TaxID=1908236 RepID=A0A1G1SQQ4_9BACT|nr:glycerophosphodiester phosphodiesterase family protein [Hymenobacter glacialis]OGX80951.1 glycerophosphodiester phosphodiesterase [Hymenobacter glacialis]
MLSPSNSLPAPLRPEVHGHRGCRGLRPENTLPAFLHALTLGVDVIELDVVISADKQVVVSHEPWLNPLICLGPAGESISLADGRNYNLYQVPYATIRRCDCGQLRHPSFPEQASQPAYKPLLSEVFSILRSATASLGRPPVSYSVEIKCTPAGDNVFHPAPAEFFDLVVAELTAAEVSERTTLLCFDARILELAHRLRPDLATCFLLEDQLPWASSLHQLEFLPSTFGPDATTITPAAVDALRSEFPSLRLVPWTVNNPTDMQRLLALGVDGMTTDYPDRLLSLLSA